MNISAPALHRASSAPVTSPPCEPAPAPGPNHTRRNWTLAGAGVGVLGGAIMMLACIGPRVPPLTYLSAGVAGAVLGAAVWTPIGYGIGSKFD